LATSVPENGIGLLPANSGQDKAYTSANNGKGTKVCAKPLIVLQENAQFPMKEQYMNQGLVRPVAVPKGEAQGVVGADDLTPTPEHQHPSAATLPDCTKPNESASKFTLVLRDLLRGGARKFKELYPMLVERQPQDCPTVPFRHGNKVSISSMEWLREIQRDLQEIAVMQNGMWCLKEEILPEFSVEPIDHSAQSDKEPSLECNGKPAITPAKAMQSAVAADDAVKKAAQHERRSAGAQRAWVKIRAKRAAKAEAAAQAAATEAAPERKLS
jgi:hypothetical protein